MHNALVDGSNFDYPAIRSDWNTLKAVAVPIEESFFPGYDTAPQTRLDIPP